ncbi:cytochrome c oxidase subunit I [Devosia neptuniae]|jgi:cytochrome c oxidase subunit I+III|uniref:cytochrome c oxidase subunit I n=1 Tax=Devosia TaxID=46913 RepID=UPI0022AE605C|nr:cytochrome c oxidase subunit I [Devosia neptuniae]MCZ4344427.1 cytochrome c oxidase subunit I [Devosia neptuniae]|tara:strand:+ start:103019 stop:105517 length:2499 start_codon:yes stop_codon:yes gene_type:complete
MSRAEQSPIGLHKALEDIWSTPPGWGQFSAVNHTILGKRFMVLALIFFTIGGVLAMLIRAQLATPASAFIGPEVYNQIFTMHGTVMMFLFAIPMFEGLAIYMLPKMLGARDLAFPRMTAYGFWCYLFGGAILIIAMLAGYAPNAGWFMYTPLSSGTYSPGINADIWLIGITFVEISAITAAIEIVVSVLKMRAPGMSLERMPIFGWYMLVTGGMMVVGFPPLILGSILLEMERAFELPYFDPTRGGDPLLWQHLFWLFGHPEVYIIFLPAAGVLSTIIPTFARRPLIGYEAVIVAIVAMAFLSFGLWVHHMFTVGIPQLALAFFSAASALVAIPTAVQIFTWIGTIAGGRPKFDIPMLYVVGFFIVFVCGGLTGVMLAMVPFNSQAHDSYFVVAHLHYVLVGGFVFPMLAALYYWLPHFTGRRSVYRLSVPAFWLILIGFNLTFFLMHLTGLMGMPRRISTYPSNWGWDWLNLLSSFGSFIMTMGFALVLTDIILQFRFGPRGPRNPWGARTLEWAMPTPPASYNFAALPAIDRRADDLDTNAIGPRLARGAGYLGFAREGRQETLGIDTLSGRPDHVIILPQRSFLPLWTALVTGGFFLSLLFKLYWLTPVAACAVIALFCLWPRGLGSTRDTGPIDIGQGEAVPTDNEVKNNVTYWASLLAVAADATLYSALLFGALYLPVVSSGWTGEAAPVNGLAALSVPAALAAAFCARRARSANAVSRTPAGWLLGAVGLALLAACACLIGIMMLDDPTSHANPALRLALFAYGALHATIAAIMAGHAWWRWRTGFVSALRATDLRLTVLWADYAALTLLPAWAIQLVLLQAGGGA